MYGHHIISLVLFLIAANMQMCHEGYWGWWLLSGLMVQLWSLANKVQDPNGPDSENQNQQQP